MQTDSHRGIALPGSSTAPLSIIQLMGAVCFSGLLCFRERPPCFGQYQNYGSGTFERFETENLNDSPSQPSSSVAADDGCPRECGTQMCDKCIQLDKKIEHYERLALGVADDLTLERIRESVRKMRAQKASLHPAQAQ